MAPFKPVIATLAWAAAAAVMLSLAVVAGAQAPGPRVAPPEFPDILAIEHRIAVFGALDKITARVTTIEAPLHQPVVFGSLSIIARSCHKRPPEDPPETTAFIEIFDIESGQVPKLVFSGWMFASSPALSALEHPVYDVWVTNCRTASAATSSDSE